MPYVRISTMRARAGEEARVRDLLDSLIGYYAKQPGYIAGYRLESADGSIGRIGIWQREEDAEHAAQTDHDLALRSQLNMSVVEHEEHAYDGVEAPSA
jgi:hypothetical protein